MLYVWQGGRNKRSRSIGAVFKAIHSNGRIRDPIAVAKPNSHASGDALLFEPPASVRLMIPGVSAAGVTPAGRPVADNLVSAGPTLGHGRLSSIAGPARSGRSIRKNAWDFASGDGTRRAA
jgi:hypothetical protein